MQITPQKILLCGIVQVVNEEKPNVFISKEIIVARFILFDLCVYNTAEISLKNGCQVFVCPLIIEDEIPSL